MAVGNPWTVAAEDNAGAVEMQYSHAIISEEVYNGIMNNCDFTTIGPLMTKKNINSSACNYWLNQQQNLMANINIYDLYADVCLSGELVGQGEQLIRHLVANNPLSPYRSSLNIIENRRAAAQFARFSRPQPNTQYPDPDPCIMNHITQYMNLPSVQSSMFVNGPITTWSGCSSIVNYSRSDLLSSMLPVYENLLTQTNLKLNVLSGDIDGICSIQGTKNWLSSSGFLISNPWSPWTDSIGQTGGWAQSYKTQTSSTTSLNFITVRDAGHMIPYFQGSRSLAIMTQILAE